MATGRADLLTLQDGIGVLSLCREPMLADHGGCSTSRDSMRKSSTSGTRCFDTILRLTRVCLEFLHITRVDIVCDSSDRVSYQI